jgi:hypothetical protein
MYFVAALAVAHDRDEVALRAARHEQRRLLAEHRRDALLQRVDGRVVAEHVVAELGAHHRLAHRGRRAGDGVAAQVDDLHGLQLQEVLQHRMAVLAEDRFGWNCTPSSGVFVPAARDGARP